MFFHKVSMSNEHWAASFQGPPFVYKDALGRLAAVAVLVF